MMTIRTVRQIVPAAESYLPGDFVVYRALPRRELRRVGGFVFFDHFDQPDITPELFDVPPHPHIGLQTVTYLFEGEILHTDSLGYEQKVLPGEVNWMTAGRGITHSEQVTETQKRVHGIQSWIGLPHDKRKIDPAFDNFAEAVLPKIERDGFKIAVIAGDCFGEASPIPTFQRLTYLDVAAAAGASIELPVNSLDELAVYVCSGAIMVSGEAVKRHDLAKLSIGNTIQIEAIVDAKLVVIGGEPLPDPTITYWNFVTDTIGQAKEAMVDWEEGKFPEVTKYRKIGSSDDDGDLMKMKLL